MALNWREYFNSKKYDPAKELATSAGIEHKEPAEGEYTGLDSWRNKFKYGLSKPSETTGFVEDEGIRQAQNDMLTEKEYLDNFTDQYVIPPLTQEEQEKRKAAAYNIGAIGALGNVASALSNLIFTGKGAVSQKIPDAPDVSKEVRQFEDDEQKKRNNAYALAKDRYAQARQRWLDLQNEQSRQQQLRIMEQRMKNYQQQGEYEKWRAEKAKYDALASQYTAENKSQEFTDKHNKSVADTNASNARAVASQAAANASNALTKQRMNGGGDKNKGGNKDLTPQQWKNKAINMGVDTQVWDRRNRKWVDRPIKDIVKDVKEAEAKENSGQGNGNSGSHVIKKAGTNNSSDGKGNKGGNQNGETPPINRK